MLYLNQRELYKIIFIILYDFYENNKEESMKFMGVADLLSNMQIFSSNWDFVDQAIWKDFLQIFQRETSLKKVNINQGIQIIKKFLIFYREEFGFEIDAVINEFENLSSDIKIFTRYVETVLSNQENDQKMILRFVD